MVWKIGSWGSGVQTTRENRSIDNFIATPARQSGHVVAHLGRGSELSKDRRDELVEQVYRIDNTLLGYNTGKLILFRCQSNQRSFDLYIGLPFTKGMTERETGRTMLIAGSDAHHGEAMIEQFDDVLWKPESKEVSYGNLLRWINAGDTRTGFIGLDYNPQAKVNDGVANKLSDIGFLAETLIAYGFDERKRLFLLDPPYIKESKEGNKLRNEGYQTLKDYLTITKRK